ncbi:MAG: hypothetical protein ACLR0N_01790 [Bilophila wadsworthia]
MPAMPICSNPRRWWSCSCTTRRRVPPLPADLPVFGTDFDLLTTLEPAILAKIRRVPPVRAVVAPAAFPGPFRRDHATEYAAPEGLGAGAGMASASAVPSGNPR